MKVKFIALTAVAAFTSSIATANEPIVVNQAITEKEAVAAQRRRILVADPTLPRAIRCG